MVETRFELTSGRLLDGRFEVERTLGQGGMGIVVAARDRVLRRTVAIKLMRPEFSSAPELAARFLREARTAAKLRSEHVARILHVGEVRGVPYFVMEYSPGHDLAEELKRNGPPELELSLEYVLQLLEALAEAHRAGIVHRDLKPANLYLTVREDDSPTLKVLDFGISKSGDVSVGGKLTLDGAMIGSPVYMSPEQIKDSANVDARSDIWSVGVLAFELVSGIQPFRAKTVPAMIAAVCANPPPALPPWVPLELQSVILKCLEKDPAQRFQSVEELARALSPFAEDLACRMSIDRILRRRSSRPPPMSESKPEDPRLSDPFRVSISAYERDAEAEAPARPSLRRPLVATGAALVAAGLLFAGYRLRSERSLPLLGPAAAPSPFSSAPQPANSVRPAAPAGGARAEEMTSPAGVSSSGNCSKSCTE